MMNNKTGHTSQGWDLPATAIVKLHTRDLDASGCPRMTEPLLSHLEAAHSSATSSAPPSPVLTLGEAWGKLTADFPRLAACVSLRYVERQTVRAAAATLGVSVRTVHTRAWAGLGQLALWCGVTAEEVQDMLQPPMRRHRV